MTAPGVSLKDAARRRPRSLLEVVQWAETGQGSTDAYLREFLDEFYVEQKSEQRAAMLVIEPALQEVERTNAYLAAVAEHLALKNGLPIPDWTNQPERFLKLPFFPAGLESLKATLLVESPPAFRRRLIFVGADPLYRPRRDVQGFTAQPLETGHQP